MKLNLGESAVLEQWGDRRARRVSKSSGKHDRKRGRLSFALAMVNAVNGLHDWSKEQESSDATTNVSIMVAARDAEKIDRIVE